MAFDFASVQSPFRMQPGLRRLAQGAQQLTPASPNSPHVREKLQALREAPHTVLGCATGFDPKPAVQALIDHAVAERPEALGRVGRGIEARQLGWAVDGDQAMGNGPIEVGNCLRQLDPEWRTAALLCLAFEEDFAIVHSATTRIPWLAVALPGGRQRPTACCQRPSDAVGDGAAALGAICLDHHARRALAAASRPRKAFALAARPGARRFQPCDHFSDRAADFHSSPRARASGFHHPCAVRAARHGAGTARRCPSRARRLGHHEPGSIGLPRFHRSARTAAGVAGFALRGLMLHGLMLRDPSR